MRRLSWRMAVILSFIGCATAFPTLAALTIGSASWDGRRLTVSGTGDRNETVTVVNAYQTSQVLGTGRVNGGGRWSVRANNPSPVPCTVQATAPGDGPVLLDVANAPGTCAPKPPQQDVCNIAVAPTTLAFGDVTVGQSATLSTTVSNSGAAACTVTLTRTGSTDFAVAPPVSFTVNPGANQSVSVTYTPTGAGADTGTLAVASNDPDSPTIDVALTGNGVQQQVCNIAVDPPALAFGDVNLGTTATRSTTVSNSGNSACNVSLVRSGSTDFAIVGDTSFSVAAGGSQAVAVTYTPGQVGADTGNLAVNSNDPDSPTVDVALTGNGVQQQVQCNPSDTVLGQSINSTSQDGCPTAVLPERPAVTAATRTHSVLAVNDLGMHCGDLDTRISSILPPFQAMLAQVVQKGSVGTARPVLNPTGVHVYYSAVTNPNDPILSSNVFDGVKADGSTYKTNFWQFPIPAGTYDAFYPAFNPFNPSQTLTPLAGPPFNLVGDLGLPVPNVEHLYLGTDGAPNTGDEHLSAVLHAMPGIAGPYRVNDPKLAEERYGSKPFFINFAFGYVAANVNWYEGAGIPFAAFDDNGRENAYPLVRVEARNAANTTVATVDTVLPISGEASCSNCHAQPADLESVTGTPSRTSIPTDTLAAAFDDPTTTDVVEGVALSMDDLDGNLPPRVSLEWAADINVLRLHDLKHGLRYVSTDCDAPGQNCLQTAPNPCTISKDNPNGSDSCLTNQALVQGKPVVCQVCHYTPALDLAQLGPLAGPEGTIANGRNQIAHKSNSNVMHSHHGSLPGNLFPTMPPPQQVADGTITNQTARLQVLEETCYQCHPGKNVQCLRGAMFNGGMLCNDCHGDMKQVGDDFSRDVTPENPGAFQLAADFYTNPNTPRVPWANEPGCGSCHTGNANNRLTGTGLIVNTRDQDGNVDGIRLRQAYRTGDTKATPIVPPVPTTAQNIRINFAEPRVPALFGDFANPGAGNPQLYRVSTGHGGVMCEGCHGATHAEWPNGNPNANDNIAATQLQGHVGALIECSTCHTNVDSLSPDGTLNSLRGPHGLHAVGNTNFARGDHRRNRDNAACRACHGANGQGTVLSRIAQDRVLECKDRTTFCPTGNTAVFPKGHMVGCTECHGNQL